jgi:hypothetical protein
MRNLDRGFERLAFPSLEELPVDSTPLVFNVLASIERIGEHIPYYFDGPLDVLSKDCHHVGCIFSGSVGIQIAPNIFNLEL